MQGPSVPRLHTDPRHRSQVPRVTLTSSSVTPSRGSQGQAVYSPPEAQIRRAAAGSARERRLRAAGADGDAGSSITALQRTTGRRCVSRRTAMPRHRLRKRPDIARCVTRRRSSMADTYRRFKRAAFDHTAVSLPVQTNRTVVSHCSAIE